MERRAPKWHLAAVEALSQDMLKLLESGMYADMFFTGEGEVSQQQIGVHRCLLWARSRTDPLASAAAATDTCQQLENLRLEDEACWKQLQRLMKALYSGRGPPFSELGEDWLTSTESLSRAVHLSMASTRGDDDPPEDTDPAGNTLQDVQGILSLQQDMEKLFMARDADPFSDVTLCILTSGAAPCFTQAHKAILAGRSTFFDALFKGPNASGNTFELDMGDCTFPVVAEVLHFLYTGGLEVSQGTVAHLLLLSDKWCLQGLRDHVLAILWWEYCRNFKKPDVKGEALVGVTQVLLLCTSALEFGLPDADGALDRLRGQCLAWLSSWAVRVWPTREFAALPAEIHQAALQAVQASLCAENCISVLRDGMQMLATLPEIKWASKIRALANRLVDASAEYAVEHFLPLVKTEAFVEMSTADWGQAAIADLCKVVWERLNPDRVVPIYRAIQYLESLPPPEDGEGSPRGATDGAWGSDAAEEGSRSGPPATIEGLKACLEGYALRNMMPVMRSKGYKAMNQEERKIFREAIQSTNQGSDSKTPDSERAKDGKMGSMFVVLMDNGGETSHDERGGRGRSGAKPGRGQRPSSAARRVAAAGSRSASSAGRQRGRSRAPRA